MLEKIKKKIRELCFDGILKVYDILGDHSNFFLRMIGYLRSNFRNFNTYKVLWLEKCTKHKIMVLKPVCESVIYSPKSLNNESDINKIVVPQINLYKFYDAIVSVRDSSILISDGVVIEDVLDFGVTTGMARYGSNLLMAHSESVAIVRLNEFETLDSGFFLGGSGSQNYYHFLIEILPKLQYFPKVSKMMGKVPILVNRIVNDITSFSKLLNVAMHNIDAELVFLEPEKTYKIKCCYYISNVNGLVFNFKPKIKNLSTPPPHSFFRRDSLDYIKNIGISLLDNANREHVFHEQLPKKIFLGRKSIRRIYNQDEVYEVFKKRGYKMIFPEDHCIEDQVRLFQNADCIAGPTGAAWTNLVFCEQKAKCLCWMDEIISWLSIFTNLAKYSGVNLNYMFCSSAAKIDSLYDACYTIDIKELEITVETLGM